MLCSSDWHLRDDVPRCRNQSQEAWLEQQRAVVNLIVDLANQYGGDLLVAGDIFHRPSASDWLKAMVQSAANRLTGAMYIMPGNHDLRHRSHDDTNTAYQVIASSAHIDGHIRLLRGHFAEVPYDSEEPLGPDDTFLGVHTMCMPEDDERGKFIQFVTPQQLRKKYKNYEYIIVGDNHHGFVDGNVVVPGCILTQSVTEDNYVKAVYQINGNGIEIIRLPIDLTEIVRDSYTEKRDDMEQHLSAFVEMVSQNKWEGLDFDSALKKDLGTLTTMAQGILKDFLEEA